MSGRRALGRIPRAESSAAPANEVRLRRARDRKVGRDPVTKLTSQGPYATRTRCGALIDPSYDSLPTVVGERIPRENPPRPRDHSGACAGVAQSQVTS
jgi:hypothetical protein